MVEDSLVERDRHDGDAVACLLAPQLVAAGTVTTPTVSMRGFDRVLFCILGGAASANNATINVTVYQHTAAVAAGVAVPVGSKVLAGLYGSKAIAQVTSGSDYATLNQKWLIEVSTEEMDVDANFDYLLLEIVVGTANWNLAVEAQRSGADYEPVAVTNITEVIGTSA